MTLAGVQQLLTAGADVITGGSSSAFEGADVEAVLGHERMLRPLNVADTVPGRGTLTTRVGGEHVRVVVLADSAALEVAPPFARMALRLPTTRSWRWRPGRRRSSRSMRCRRWPSNRWHTARR